MIQMKYPLLLSLLISVVPLACGSDDGDPSDADMAESSDTSDGSDGDVAVNGSSGTDPGATETNAVPAVCETSDDCGGDIECVVAVGDEFGYCNVSETDVEAPEGLPVNGGDEPETGEAIEEEPVDGEVSSSSGTVSLGAPAICGGDDECPDGIECIIARGDEFGYCNVEEAVVTDDEPLPANTGDEPPLDEAVEEDDGSGVVSLGAAAPCETDADCPEDIGCVVPEEGGVGFCDVTETLVTNLPSVD